MWSRLGSIANIYTGNSINETEKATKYTNLPEGRNFIATKDVNFDCSICYNNGVKIPESESKFRVAPEKTILLCIEGGSAGRKIGITQEDVCFGNKLCAFVPYIMKNEYLFYFLQTSVFTSIFKSNVNGIIGGVSINKIKEIIIPIPPLEEQKRIVAKIEELLPHIDEYGKCEVELTKLNKDFPEALKKSILQAAVQGKLVPQYPNDESAEKLLEKIRVERQKLIKEGKIKKSKTESQIFRRGSAYYEKCGSEEKCIDKEIPFEIPSSWTWVRLGNLIQLQSGQDLTPNYYSSENIGIPYLTGASNIQNERIILNRWTKNPKSIALNGDLLITCKGTIGDMAILEEEKVHIARQIMSIRPIGMFSVLYLKYFMKTYLQHLQIQAKSMIPGISRIHILNLLLPLPPLSEQKRIVAKIEELLGYCDRLK